MFIDFWLVWSINLLHDVVRTNLQIADVLFGLVMNPIVSFLQVGGISW